MSRELVAALVAAIEDPARTAQLPEGPRTLSVARRHRLSPLLSVRCRDALPKALAHECRHDYVLTVARNLAFAAVAEECVSALGAAGVQAALLKGLAYAPLYPPGARPTGDIDLLVRLRDRRAAFEVLDKLGFEPRAAAPGFDDPEYHEVAWRRADVEVDLHLALAPLARCAIDYDEIWGEMRPLDLGAARAWVLAPAHAAIFHALHMAIDHFDVPALYLLDLACLVPTEEEASVVAAKARAWRCHRPLATSMALAAAFQPAWAPAATWRSAPWPAERVIAAYGDLSPLPRPEQLLRKLAHFDAPTDALRYVAIQSRRNVHELIERRVRRRSARARLDL